MKISHCILLLLFTVSACMPAPENINVPASLPEDFQFEKMGLKTIGATINPEAGTNGILYGNNNALTSLKNPALSIKGEKILTLVTWKQRDDPRWFGAKSPYDFLMIEVLKTNNSFNENQKITYELIKGKTFTTHHETDTGKRIQLITAIRPAVMP